MIWVLVLFVAGVSAAISHYLTARWILNGVIAANLMPVLLAYRAGAVRRLAVELEVRDDYMPTYAEHTRRFLDRDVRSTLKVEKIDDKPSHLGDLH